MRFRALLCLFAILLLAACIVSSFARPQAASNSTPTREAILASDDVGNKLLPEKVFFRGQIAPVQARNSGGVRYADGLLDRKSVV